jgi:hypothetical protein
MINVLLKYYLQAQIRNCISKISQNRNGNRSEKLTKRSQSAINALFLRVSIFLVLQSEENNLSTTFSFLLFYFRFSTHSDQNL